MRCELGATGVPDQQPLDRVDVRTVSFTAGCGAQWAEGALLRSPDGTRTVDTVLCSVSQYGIS